jgi:xanthosine utilization system XapX-like protein
MRLVVGILAYCLVALPMNAERMNAQKKYSSIGHSGTDFLEVCKYIDEEPSAHAWDDANCLGFISGFIQGMFATEEYHKTPNDKQIVCPPDEVATLEYVRIVKKHIEEEPGRAHMATRNLASEALVSAFPCKK